VVFGSRARGDWKPWSDVDVLVVLREAPRGFERLTAVPYAPMVQPWVYTEGEARAALESFDLALLDALEHGVVLYDDGFWGELKGRFAALKEEWGLEEVEGGWVSRRIAGQRGGRG